MSLSETPVGPTGRSFGVTWSAAIAGAVVAAALAFVLDSFGVAIGLGLSSASPTWRDTSFALVLLSGLYLLLTALAAYALGGYFADSISIGIKDAKLRSRQRFAHGVSAKRFQIVYCQHGAGFGKTVAVGDWNSNILKKLRGCWIEKRTASNQYLQFAAKSTMDTGQ